MKIGMHIFSANTSMSQGKFTRGLGMCIHNSIHSTLKPLLHPVVHPGCREKSADLQGTLKYLCNFITEFQGSTDAAMKIDMHIFSVCTQYGHKHIHFSRVTYERLAHLHFPCKCCKISPLTCRFACVV